MRLTDGPLALAASFLFTITFSAGVEAAPPRPFVSPDGPRPAGASEARRLFGDRRHGHGTGTSEAPATLFNGAPAMAAPKVVPIIFPGSPLDAQIRDFFTKLAGSEYWQTTTSEYGVGPITLLPAYAPPGAAPDNATIGQWMAELVQSGTPGVPAPDDDTIYAIVLPAGWGADAGACVTFGAYHSTAYTDVGQRISFTVNPICTVPYLGLTGIGQITDSLSHEIEESATDPDGAEWAAQNWAASGWGAAAEGDAYAETADMCEFQPNAAYVDPQIGYLVQRIWSNASAAAGHDPCLPLLPIDPVYFIAEPYLPEGARVWQDNYARGLQLSPGQEITVPVVLRADGKVGEWQLGAAEVPNPHLPADVYDELSFSWDRPSGRAGDTRYLTIKRSPPPAGAAPVFLRVAIDSTLGSISHTSWLLVGDADPRTDADHAPAPRVESGGGPVISRVVPIVYAADAYAADLQSYFAALGKSRYLPHALGEYGVPHVTVAPPVVLADTPPASVLDIDVAAWLASQIDSGALPPEDGNTLYQIVYPASTQVYVDGVYGLALFDCASWPIEAYPATTGPAPLSIIPNCGFPWGAGSVLDFVTVESSSGIADSLTNPFATESPGYTYLSWAGTGVEVFSRNTVSGLCFVPAAQDTSGVPADLGYRVAGIWSDRAAAEDHNPCPPVSGPQGVYFNAAMQIAGGTVPYGGYVAKGLILPPAGGQVTIPVQLFSDGPTGEWTLSATERLDLDAQPSSILSFSFDKPTGRAGDVRRLTITRGAPGPDGPATALAFEVVSTLGGVSYEWVGLIGND